MLVVLQADPLEPVGEAQGLLFGQVIQLGEFLIDETVVGAEELVHWAVLHEHVAEEQARLGLHRGG